MIEISFIGEELRTLIAKKIYFHHLTNTAIIYAVIHKMNQDELNLVQKHCTIHSWLDDEAMRIFIPIDKIDAIESYNGTVPKYFVW